MIKAGKCLLRQRLAEVRMTQIDLAIKSGRSETTISDHISGRKGMSKETMYLYSYIIGCHMEDLYEWIWDDD